MDLNRAHIRFRYKDGKTFVTYGRLILFKRDFIIDDPEHVDLLGAFAFARLKQSFERWTAHERLRFIEASKTL